MGENIRLALKGIWSHRLRSFLTMLGVIIGIASIIAIVSTIKGTNEQIMQNLIGAASAGRFGILDGRRSSGQCDPGDGITERGDPKS